MSAVSIIGATDNLQAWSFVSFSMRFKLLGGALRVAPAGRSGLGDPIDLHIADLKDVGKPQGRTGILSDLERKTAIDQGHEAIQHAPTFKMMSET